MASTINTNVMSLNAQRNLTTSQNSMATSMQRLSSGLRVNSARDDAAGLAIADRMQAQVRGMNVAIRNANDGVSLAQTAEGALSKISDSLQRMRELAVQSANATNTTSDRSALADEFKELQSEIKRVVESTRFNNVDVLKGGTFTFQVGANNTGVDRVDILVSNMGTGNLQIAFTSDSGGTTGIVVDSAAAAGTALDKIDDAIAAVNTERSKMGASANRFDSIIGSLQVNVENQSAARGRIIDADFAVETANFTRSQILQQAGNAMLAQANSAPQQVLSLLRF